MERILVATDAAGSDGRTVEWAAELAERCAAELLLLQNVAPEHLVAGAPGDGGTAAGELAEVAARLAGDRGRSRRVYDSDPAAAIVRVAEEEGVDIVVVGGRSMSERTEFMLASVPNRVSHTARCTVVLVNDTEGRARPSAPTEPEPQDGEPTEGELLGRAARIGGVLARYGLGNLL